MLIMKNVAAIYRHGAVAMPLTPRH